MRKSVTKIVKATVALAMMIGSGVGAIATSNRETTRLNAESTLIAGQTFDFEDETAHRTSGSNSYTGTNTYKKNTNGDISLRYADSAGSGTPLNGDYHVIARVAKNTTNSPTITIGPVDLSSYNVMGISYYSKGVNSMTVASSYSLDGSNWTNLESHTASSTATVYGNATNLASALAKPSSLYFKIVISVASSTNSNRDVNVDDISFYGEQVSVPKTVQANSVTIKSGEQTIEGTYEPTSSYHVKGTLDLTNSFVGYQQGESFKDGDGDINWSSSVTDVATVANGIVTFVNSGTTTITATAVDKGAGDTTVFASFTLNLENLKGSVANPYSVAEAVAAIVAANAQINGVYVTGIVSQVDTYDVNYHSITYWISDDGTTTDQFEVYGGKGIDGADFDFINDVETGATVVVYGNIKKYSSTYEFTANSQLVTYSPLTKYTVSFNSNEGSSVPSQRVIEGQKAQKPTNPTKDPDVNYSYTFANWYEKSDFSGNPFDFVNTSITRDITLYAKWNQVEREATAVLNSLDTSSSLAYHYHKDEYLITDTLNNAFTGGITGTSYKDWSGKQDESDAVYKGNSAGDHESIQLRSSNGSGIVTTTSSGKVRRITVAWESNTADGRTLDIYGKNTAYSAASDLYNDSNKGTKIGSIVYGTSTSLEITGDYAFLGIRSNSGAQYVDSIEVVWEFADPDFIYSNVAIKFGGEVSTTLWSKLESRGILGFGVMLTEPSYLTSISASSIESLYESKEATAGSIDAARELRDGIYYIKDTNVKYFYSEVSASAPRVSDGNRVWNLSKAVNGTNVGLTRNYTAVAFVRTSDDGLVFLKQTTKSAAKIADDYYDVDLDASVEGSLGNLALMLG